MFGVDFSKIKLEPKNVKGSEALKTRFKNVSENLTKIVGWIQKNKKWAIVAGVILLWITLANAAVVIISKCQ